MPLVDCPECQAKLDTAWESCPQCGYPTEKLIADKEIRTPVSSFDLADFFRSSGTRVALGIAECRSILLELFRHAGWIFWYVIARCREQVRERERRREGLSQSISQGNEGDSSPTHSSAYWRVQAAEAWAHLVPRDALIRRRLVIGYASSVGLLVLAFVFSVLFSGNKALTATGAERRVEIDVPVLLVSKVGGVSTGHAASIKLTVRRRAGNKEPLSLAVAETTPSGAGSQIRASLWQATMVAALSREDDLAGTELTFSVAGDIDGPSAGGVCCLAILSALDGRSPPADFAFTGSILPDGTIGRVGGIVQKIQAAKRAGARRILAPAYLNIDYDLNTGKPIDIRQLCDSLELQYLPVVNIDEAYQQIYRLPLSKSPEPDLSSAMLSPSLEAVLAKRTDEFISAGDHGFSQLPEQEQSDLVSNPGFEFIVECRQEAERSRRSGHLFVAYDKALLWQQICQAPREKDIPVPAQDARGLDELLASVESRVEKHLASYASPHSILESLAKDLPPIAGQFASEMPLGDSDRFLIEAIQNAIRRSAPSGKAGAQAQELHQRQMRDFCTILLMYSHGMAKHSTEFPHSVRQLASTTADVPAVVGAAKRVEGLFFSCVTAGRHSLIEVDGVGERSAELPFLVLTDRSNIMHDVASKWATAHRGADFTNVVATQIHARTLAVAGGIASRSEFGPVYVDGQLESYERPELLGRTVQIARRNALSNIDACRKLGIPCPLAISEFHHAEASFAQIGTDQVDVLAAYWLASLRAQALRMTFGPSRNTGPAK